VSGLPASDLPPAPAPGKLAYDAFRAAAAPYLPPSAPEWERLPRALQEAWSAAAKAAGGKA
jgi:hypothetical protein